MANIIQNGFTDVRDNVLNSVFLTSFNSDAMKPESVIHTKSDIHY